jgi:hypothetical protein
MRLRGNLMTWAVAAALLPVAATNQTLAASRPGAVVVAEASGEGALIERSRRDTCWRTNRRTKQRFRIC